MTEENSIKEKKKKVKIIFKKEPPKFLINFLQEKILEEIRNLQSCEDRFCTYYAQCGGALTAYKTVLDKISERQG